MTCPTILMVEDHPLMAHAVQTSLSVWLNGVRFFQANSATEGLSMLQSHRFDLLLLDLQLPDSQGMKTLDLFCASRPLEPMLVYSMMQDEALINACMANHVSYVCKSEPASSLLDRVLNTLQTTVTPAPCVQETSNHAAESGIQTSISSLSPRQLHVLSMLAQGHSCQEMADQLGLEPSTVRSHLHAIYQRLGVKNKTQAASVYWRWIRQFGEMNG